VVGGRGGGAARAPAPTPLFWRGRDVFNSPRVLYIPKD